MDLLRPTRLSQWAVLVMVWVVLAVILLHTTNQVGRYVDSLDRLGLRGAHEASTPLKYPRFNFAADAQTWIEYALQLTEGGDQWQLRYTHIDNAPIGREVHWNSYWAWLIGGAGVLRRHFEGEALPQSIEHASLWLNPVVLWVLIVLFSSWATKRAGAWVGFLVALGMVGSDRFFEGFIPTYVDHHGLLTSSVFGLVLGAIFMGDGWWRTQSLGPILPNSPRQCRQAAILSAICGAAGMWVSAASVVPPIAITGIIGLAATLIRGRRAISNGYTLEPSTWRLWGTTGAVVSLLFYLLEYAPYHIGMRLEANHPFYAFAWWGGGELIAQISEYWIQPEAEKRTRFIQLGVAVGSLLVVPATIWIGGPKVFLPSDPFLAALHQNILEFLSLIQRAKFSGWRMAFHAIDISVIPLVIVILLLLQKRAREEVLLWYGGMLGITFIAMGVWQERWLLNASGPAICVTILAVDAASRQHRWLRHRAVGVICTVLLFLPPIVIRARNFDAIPGKGITKDAMQPLFRDVAAALRASQPNGGIVLLSSPNSSTGIGYYGRFQTIGTLYWENNDGLKAAARMFSAETDDEAAKLIKERGVTHIAMISEENFIAPYYALLHPGAPQADVKKSFGYRLMTEGRVPPWLEVLPYQVPEDLRPLNVKVMLYKVAFGQSVADALYHLGVAQVAWGYAEAAEQTFDNVIRTAPKAPEPWLRKYEIDVAQSRWDDAFAAATKGIALAPLSEQQRLSRLVAQSFSNAGAIGHAIRMYQQELKTGYDQEAAYDLSWILATTRQADLRNGEEALALARRLVDLNPTSPAYLSCLAAAKAECGRMDDAIQIVRLALSHAGNDPEVTQKLNAHLAKYQAGEPWRD